MRGEDILDSTPRQNFLYQCFSHAKPQYYHVPLVKNIDGSKLSKSLGSTAINTAEASKLLLKALKHLGQAIELDMESAQPEEIIVYYVNHWN